MSYKLDLNESLCSGLKRIATEQVDKALTQIRKTPEGEDEAVHDVRKRLKRVRALLRLVRDELGEFVYKQENGCYRDAGRRLSDVRDSFVMVETLDYLRDYFGEQLQPDVFDPVRHSLQEAHHRLKAEVLEEGQALTQVGHTLNQARERIAIWPIENQNFSAMADGLKRVYKRGRKRLAQAYADPSVENFHEWRKRAKYWRYQLRILRNLWPAMLNPLRESLHDLSDYLGDDHDLAELRARVQQDDIAFNSPESRQTLLALIDQRRAKFRTLARPIGERAYVEKPKHYVRRMAGYWDVAMMR